MDAKKKWVQGLLMGLLVVAVAILAVACAYLFYHQTIDYPCDLRAHIRSGRKGGTYSMTTHVYSFLFHIWDNDLMVVGFLVLVMVATVPSLVWGMKTIAQAYEIQAPNVLWGWLAFSTLFMCNYYIPRFGAFFYESTAATQPWHNSSYILLRLFAIPCFALYVKIEKTYLEKGICVKDWICFCVLLSLCNWTKPNFLLAFAPMMLLFLVVDFVRCKAKGTLRMIMFGCAVLLSLPVCFLQMGILFPEESGNGVYFTMEKLRVFFSAGNRYGIVYFASGLFVPMLVLLISLYRDRKNNRLLLQGWVMYIFAWFAAYTLFEYGARESHGNFGWGRRIAGLVLMVASLIKLIGLLKQKKITIWTFVVLMVFYLVSVGYGLYYFRAILSGNNYFC